MDAVASLAGRLPEGAVSTHPGELGSRSRDSWALAMLREARGERLPRPLAVVFPTTPEDVVETLLWAAETRTPVVPRGGGSGVCGGAQAIWRGIVLDLSRMNRVLEIDERSATVAAEAGIRGDRLETALGEHGLTLGHYPQSVAISSLGGWIASASAGQASAGFGAIEDNLLACTAVLGTGEVVELPPAPRSATGPDLRRLLVGSEGTLGVVTSATISVAPARLLRWAAFAPASFHDGMEHVRRLVQAGEPALVVRLYDDADAAVSFGALGHTEGPVLLLGFAADAQLRLPDATPLDPSYGEHWWHHRNDGVDLYRRIMGSERMLGAGTLVDTMEVAGTWSRLEALYAGVRDALLESASAAGCHLSHPYRSGASLYFTFLLQGESDEAAERRYLEAWRRAAGACREAGGTVSHHHGIGLLKAPFLEAELGPGAIGALRAIKAALDPAGILNPGKLLEAQG